MSIDVMHLLLGATIRALALGVLALFSLRLFPNGSSAARHATWTVVLIGMLLEIPLGALAPTVDLKVLPAIATPKAELEAKWLRPSLAASVKPPRALAPAAHANPEARSKGRSSTAVAFGAYLMVSFLLFLRLALGLRGVRGILRDAKTIPGLGAGIFESDLLTAPGSVGFLRPRILLPRAWKNWDRVKLRAVLAHETAHIRRRDWPIRVAAQVNVCIFWFHPLAWWIDRELARLAEEAADDLALSEIEDREQYAATLLDVAFEAAAHRRMFDWRVSAMASESNAIERVNRILSRRRMPKPFGAFAWAALLACGLPAIYLSSAVKLASANRDSTLFNEAAVRGTEERCVRPSTQQYRAQATEQKSSTRHIAQEGPDPRLTSALPIAAQEDTPITMCILVDNSGSMAEHRAAVEAAAMALAEASKPQDELCIVHFNDEAFGGLPYGKDFTSDVKEMEEAIRHIDSRGGSAMRDAVQKSIDQVQQTGNHQRKVLVLVTDGNDTSSLVTQNQLLDKVRNSGVRVYSIGLLNENSGQAAATRLGLRQLGEASGGRDYYPKDVTEIERISPAISDQARR